MTWKKTLIRNLLFAVLCMAAVFCCTGCFTSTILLDTEFGSRSTYFGVTTYTMSPDRREIIATSTKTTNFRYLLSMSLNRPEFISPKTLWSWRSTWEERIPLDSMPECLMRCFLIAEPDPDAQQYWYHSRGGYEMETDGLPLGPDEILHLRVRPEEMGILSRPFWVRLTPREDERSEADGTALAGQETPQDEEDVPLEKKPEDDLRIMFPVGIYGNMYVLLTVVPREPRPNPVRAWADKGRPAPLRLREYAESMWDVRESKRYLYPFREGQEEILLTEYERLIRVRPLAPDTILWKTLWLPSAIVADTLLMPYYIVAGTGALLLIMTVGSAIQ